MNLSSDNINLFIIILFQRRFKVVYKNTYNSTKQSIQRMKGKKNKGIRYKISPQAHDL